MWEQHFKRVDPRIVDSVAWDGKGVARIRVKLGMCGCSFFSGLPVGQRAGAWTTYGQKYEAIYMQLRLPTQHLAESSKKFLRQGHISVVQANKLGLGGYD